MKKKIFYVVSLITMLVLVNNLFVIAVTKDTTPPVLKSVSISNHEFIAGDKVEIKLDVYDDVAGIDNILITYSDPSTLNKIFQVKPVDNSYFIIPNNVAPGEYELDSIRLYDKAGNTSIYTSNANSTAWIYMDWGNNNITIKPSGNDITGPVLANLQIDKTSVAAGDQIKVSADITDEGSGVKSALVFFNVVATNNCKGVYLYYNETEKKFVGFFTTPNLASDYTFDYVLIEDNNGNSSVYTTKDKIKYAGLNPSPNTHYVLDNIKFTVTSGIVDKEKPKLINISLDKKSIEVPSTLNITADVTDDSSGVELIDVQFSKKNSDNTYTLVPILNTRLFSSNNNKESRVEGKLNIQQYLDVGTYKITSVSILDNAGHWAYYGVGSANPNEIVMNYDVSFEIVEKSKLDITTSTIATDLIEKIKGADDGAKISIDSSNNSTVKKEVFEAIKATNKKIYIESNGIQWIFDGSQIVEPKDIDVKINSEMIYNYDDNLDLKNKINNGIVISFAPNGVLPGKALVRIKAEYTFRDYLGDKDLQVYYYNEDNKLFDRVVNKLEITDDGYYEFYIDHNSTFVISNKEPKAEYISEDNSKLLLNESTSVDLDSMEKSLNEKVYNIVKNEISTNTKIYIVIGGTLFLIIVIIIVFIIIRKKGNKKNKDVKESKVDQVTENKTEQDITTNDIQNNENKIVEDIEISDDKIKQNEVNQDIENKE